MDGSLEYWGDGIYHSEGEDRASPIVFAIGPVRLRCDRDTFYGFTVLVLDSATGVMERHYPNGELCCYPPRVSGELEFASMPGFGRVYECSRCRHIHIEVLGQSLVVAAAAYPYLLDVVRMSAVELETRFPVDIASGNDT
jgi:hypothetical protein